MPTARILIVDDSLDARILLETITLEAGLGEVLQAASGAEALEMMNAPDATRHDIDLVLLDIGLPDMSGIQTCRGIRRIAERHPTQPAIIMVTAHDEVAMLEAAFLEGAVDYVTKPVRKGELIARMRAALARKSENDQRDRHQVQLEFQAGHDTLTGVSRRRVFTHALRQEWRRAARHAAPVSVMMLDVDNFHAYNEAYGHLAGDECLRRVAESLQKGLHRQGDAMARFGGEEFAVLLPETDLAGAIAVAEVLRAGVEALAIPHSGSPVASVVTVSVGVASQVPAHDMAPETLLQSADEALYTAKAAGRNRVRSAGRGDA
jgi:two-component system, chemotaxis family, response regulator WspR